MVERGQGFVDLLYAIIYDLKLYIFSILDSLSETLSYLRQFSFFCEKTDTSSKEENIFFFRKKSLLNYTVKTMEKVPL